MTDERDGEYLKIIKQSYKRQTEGADEDLTDKQFYERVQGMTDDQKAQLQRDAHHLFDEKFADWNKKKLDMPKYSNLKSKSDTKRDEMSQDFSPDPQASQNIMQNLNVEQPLTPNQNPLTPL